MYGKDHQTPVTEILVTDDACIVTNTGTKVEQEVKVLLRVTSRLELTVSLPMTKPMEAEKGLGEADVAPICFDDTTIEAVTEFWSLGGMITPRGW